MLSDEQILAGMRERVNHPATAKELLHLLKVSRDDRTSFKRRLRALVQSGALIEIRGNRFGLPDDNIPGKVAATITSLEELSALI